MTRSTRRQDQVVNLLQVLRLLFEATEADHGLVSHQSGAVVESLLHARRLIEHLHCVVVVNARWKLNPNLLFRDGLQKSRLDAICEGKLEDLLVANIVVPLRVDLEHGRVRGNDLEIVSVHLGLFFCGSRLFNLLLLNLEISAFGRSKCIGDTDDHSSRILKDVHIVGLKD